MALRFLLIGLACGIDAACAEDARPEATPYRPTVSTPAALSAPGWVEVEIGGLESYDRSEVSSSTHRASVPYTVKYAFTEDWGVRIGGEALVAAHDIDGVRRVGFGDTSLTVKRRLAIDDDSALGVEVAGLAPTARAALRLGSGKPDWSTSAIYSVDFAGWHGDANWVETRMGARTEATSRWQALGAVALSHPLGDRVTIATEVSGTRQHGDAATAQALGAVAYALRRYCVFDMGVARGLNRASPTWQAFAGMTLVIGKLE